MDTYEYYLRLERRSAKSKNKSRAGRLRFAMEHERQFGDFQCQHCRLHVSAEPILSGVNNRNHCPYCLWSKHVDLYQPGDRLSACKGPMKPVGLTLKRLHKKYASAQPGELMIIHQCVACGALSINRIAADDQASVVWDVFEGSLALESALKADLQRAGIEAMGITRQALVQARLFGHGAKPSEHFESAGQPERLALIEE